MALWSAQGQINLALTAEDSVITSLNLEGYAYNTATCPSIDGSKALWV
jgi:hypothetical protein